MPSPTFDSTFFCSIPEMFPTAIANNDPVQHSPIAHYYVKHLKWYFDDADLFFSQRGILFGLHQHKFNNLHFSRQLRHIEPCKTAAIGTLPSLHNLSISTFITFPSDFSTDLIKWNNIKDLAMTWGFVNTRLLAMQKIPIIGSICC